MLYETLEEGGGVKARLEGYQMGGKTGVHSEYLGYILTDLQYIQRSMPGLNW